MDHRNNPSSPFASLGRQPLPGHRPEARNWLRFFALVLAFVLLVSVLFGALALFPVWAQAPKHGRAAPDEPLAPEPGDVSAQLLIPSTTGYVIDDGDTGFTPPPPYPTGNWLYFTGGGYKGDCLYTAADSSGDVATWRPDLAYGIYDVQVHWWADSTWRRDDALFTIYCADGTFARRVNQKADATGTPIPTPGGDSGWYSLGRYRFWGGTSGSVTLSDITTTFGSGTNIVADGVRFLPVEVWVDDDYCTWCTNGGHLWGVTAFDNIRDGILAVADYGTVHVGAGNYYQLGQNITVTKPITLSGAGAASTVISVTAASGVAAIELLSNNVRISGFTIEGSGVTYGIVNRRSVPFAWIPDITDYRISNNVIRGFQLGIYLWRAKGEIGGNTVYNNSGVGIYLEDFPSGTLAGPSIVSGNSLYANGSGATDYDIQIQDSYTGTAVSNNVITGSLGANEAGIYVFNKAGDLTLSLNRIMNCTKGIWILTNSGSDIQMQKVNLQGNTITGGTTGVHIQWIAGSSSLWQTIIGGSLANANNIYGNSGDELRLTQYNVPVTATYNYWGVCSLREIEGEVWHGYDAVGEGTVTYEPAICVPYSITLQAVPTSLPADGISTAALTATVRDVAGYYVRPGTMVGITTSLGSVPYGYAEAEDATAVTANPPANWTSDPYGDERVSGGAVLYSDTSGDWAEWTFNGEAISLIYVTEPGAGTADISVDGSYVKTIDFASTGVEYRIENVIATGLGSGPHTVRVTHQGAGRIRLDAFRSGGVVGAGGRVVTTLTSSKTAGTASVWASVYNGRIITAVPPPYPFVTATVTVTFSTADVYVSKSASPATLNPGREVTYTITYGNNGPETATNVWVTDTLPANFTRVRSSSSPNREPPVPVSADKYAWHIGSLSSGVTGTITLVARAGQSGWLGPTVVTNVVEIGTDVTESAAGNNSASAGVTVVPAAAARIIVTLAPAAILADGAATATVTATVADANNNPVVDGTLVTFTTNLNTVFLPDAVSTKVVTTTSGVATTTLQAGTVAGTATVTGRAGTAQSSAQIQLLPLEPHWVTLSANPPWIRVSPRGNITTTLTITVTDQYNNLVDGARVNLTTTMGTFVGSLTNTLVVTTTQGRAFAGLASGCTVTTATVTAEITTTGRPTATLAVFFQAGLPYTITPEANPTTIRVCGDTAVVTATIQDECGNPVEDGTVVNFNVVPGAAGDMDLRSATTVGGVATSTLRTKGYLFGQRYLDVYILSRVSAFQRINLEVGLAHNISLTPSPSTIPVYGDSIIRAWVRDCGGNNVLDGTPVTFTVSGLGSITPTLTSTYDGMAEAIFKAACTAGRAIITATSDSRSFTTTVWIEPGAADHISVQVAPNTIRNCSGTAVVTATLYDICHNLVKDGTQVQFAPQYGYVSTSPVLGVTRGGQVTATVRALSTTLSTWPVSQEQVIVTSGPGTPGFTTLWIVPGNPGRVNVQADPGSIPTHGWANGYDITVSARVADCSDTPVEDGTPVRLQTNLGLFRDSGMRSFNTTTVGGMVTATLTSEEAAGLVTVSASAGTVSGTTTVRFLPGEPWFIEVSAIPETIPANGRTTSLVAARLRDEDNNPVLDGITVTFITDHSYFLESGSFEHRTTTNLDGFAFATLVADTVPGTALVRAVAYNGRQNFTYVFFVVLPTRYLYLPIIYRRFAP